MVVSAAALVACGKTSPTGPTAPTPPPSEVQLLPPPPPVSTMSADAPILVGAGDIGDCSSDGAKQTAALLDSIPGAFDKADRGMREIRAGKGLLWTSSKVARVGVAPTAP